MNKTLRKKIARQVVNAMNMKDEETLRINGGVHEQDLVEEIALMAEERGVHAGFTTASDNFIKESYERIPEKYLSKTSKLALKIIEVLDNTITIERPKDPRIMENIDPNKQKAATQGGRPISRKMDEHKVKWCYLGYPTEEMASKLGIKYSLLKKFIFDATLVNPKILVARSTAIKKGIFGAKQIKIWDEYGTDLTLRMANRKIMMSDGLISNDDIKHGDVGLNLPDGEVFTTPLETAGSGVLFSPKRRDRFTGKMIENIRMIFENGKLNLQKTTAEKNEKYLKRTIKICTEIDKKNEKTVRTTNFAELGIGTNPVIDRIIGYLLTDEKIGGTIHIAIGDNGNPAYGGKSHSCLHWDFITHKGVNLKTIYPNGKEIMVLENGKIVKN